MQDEVPALAVAAAFADGVTEVRDAAELAVKESNRIGAVHQELSELGLAVETRADGLVIRGGQPRAALLKSHGDHRIAMAAAVAANAIDGESTVRGLAGGVVVVSRVRRRSRAASRARSERRRADARSSRSTARRDRESRRSRAASPARSGCRCSTPARCTGRSRWPRSSAASRSTTSRRAPRLAREHDDRGRRRHHDDRRPRRERRDPRARGDRGGVDGRGASRRCARCSSRSSGRGWREHGGGVVEGRDIGTVVFPAAPAQGVPDRQRRRAGAPPPARRSGVGAGRSTSTTCAPRSPGATRSTAAGRCRRCGRPTTRSSIDTTDRDVDDVVAELVERARAAGIG